MGVALYVQGYFKHGERISGQIKSLGYYEVDKEAIEVIIPPKHNECYVRSRNEL
jgi:hypothetical protein